MDIDEEVIAMTTTAIGMMKLPWRILIASGIMAAIFSLGPLIDAKILPGTPEYSDNFVLATSPDKATEEKGDENMEGLAQSEVFGESESVFLASLEGEEKTVMVKEHPRERLR